MQSVQESKQELEASIRYAENAISSAKQTIESMEFRQEMAKKNHQEQTGREEALQREVAELHKIRHEMQERIDELMLREEERNINMALLTDEAEFYKKSYTELEVAQGRGVPTMPVIPKDVAIAIFREGIATGVLSACSELEGRSINVSEDEYVGSFSVSFERDILLDDELDFDWMRERCADYTEDAVIDSLKGLCADNKFECRIHGVDDNENKKDND